MIPEEVGNIAYIIREWFDPDFDDSIDAAWQIYNEVYKPMQDSYERAHLEGSY